jgi:hypothetical protein
MANWRKADIIWDMPRDVRAGDVARPPAGATTAPRTMRRSVSSTGRSRIGAASSCIATHLKCFSESLGREITRASNPRKDGARIAPRC